jgi:hypothetical protein
MSNVCRRLVSGASLSAPARLPPSNKEKAANGGPRMITAASATFQLAPICCRVVQGPCSDPG